eukprot:TRINITY_DN1446_c1_g2_i1.p1 TRINITY_DN1446_c1_g2~~TRINITY_DN1446_c1_g2_i1.p1  ORF type:complete len:396 (+),score=73.89 TRINITY_DN1446_c1_g2_i1:119-1306(+)
MTIHDSEGKVVKDLRYEETPDWCVLQCEEKGKGLFTARSFKPGEEVIKENPAVVVDNDSRVAESKLEKKLTKNEKETLKTLQNRGEGLMGIFNTNCFTSNDTCFIYRIISRVNHSCHPNCFIDINETTGSATLKTFLDISTNTELTISYNRESHGMSRKLRCETLKNTKKFTCKCKLCTTDTPDPALGGVPSEKETQELQIFILSHSENSPVQRSLEEFIAGIHVVGELLSYQHWGCLHIGMVLLKNSIAAVESCTEEGDTKGEERWTIILLKLLTFCVNRSKAIVPKTLSSSFVQIFFSAASQLLLTPSPPLPVIILTFSFIQPFHELYYTPEDPDSTMIAAVLNEYGTGVRVAGMGLQDDLVSNKDFLRLGINDEANSAIQRHTERLVKKMRK